MNDYINLKVKITPNNTDAADLMAAFLADIGFESFETTEEGLNAYIKAKEFDASQTANALTDFPFDVCLEWEAEMVKGKDWNEEWEKNYFQPQILAEGRCLIRSSFHTDCPKAEYEIIIDPKMAFGTGHHATTSMMVGHLFDLELRGKKVVDMGSGTGILAILAKKLGAGDVTGIEIDPGAYKNALENVALNHADVKMICGDASALKEIKNAEVFLANINRNIILADIDRYAESIEKGGVIVLSGFYNADISLLEAALAANGFEPTGSKEEEGGWASLRAVKK